MTSDPAITLKSLREQVYDFLRLQIRDGALQPGVYLDLNALAESIGTSRTPLRDALLQLDAEGFVSIVPRKGVMVNRLEVQDIREIYQIVGALEAMAVEVVGPTLKAEDFALLRRLDKEGQAFREAGDLASHMDRNYRFHDFFLERLGNGRVTRLVHQQKQRLYEWTRLLAETTTWDSNNHREHEDVVAHLEAGRIREAAAYMRDVHWGFEVQEHFVREAYFGEVGRRG